MTGRPTPHTQPVNVVRVAGGVRERRRDLAASEEPLEIRLHGSRFVVTMRTPGSDRELAAGFLLAERIIDGLDDLATMRHCTDAGSNGNILDVTLAGDAAGRVEAALATRRAVVATSACGVCGRQSIDDLLQDLPHINADWSIAAAIVETMPARLRSSQAVFDETGGLHAAGLFDCEGTLVAVAEDVGRHNAVDKVVGGQLLREQIPLNNRLLFVSGRTSFEIVQKAAVAGIPMVAAVSAPSSLAIELARRANITLLGFVRDGTFNIYTGEERVRL
jgi:FdhD protein